MEDDADIMTFIKACGDHIAFELEKCIGTNIGGVVETHEHDPQQDILQISSITSEPSMGSFYCIKITYKWKKKLLML